MATIGGPPIHPDRKSKMLTPEARQRANEAARQGGAHGPARQAPNGAAARQPPNGAARQTPSGAPKQAPHTGANQAANQATAKQAANAVARREAEEVAARQEREEASGKRSLFSAFTALKQTRLFKNRVKKTGVQGKPFVTGFIALFEDYLEVAIDHQRARTYLGDESEEGGYGQARREALLVQHLERLGGNAIQMVRYLLSLLAMDRERDFKHYIVDQVRPRLDSLAGRLSDYPTVERRLLAALVTRASYQVGARSAENFSKLLAALGAAEAVHWSESSDRAVVRAQQLAESLRVAASPAYRTALIEKGRDSLKRLAGDTVGLPLEEIHPTWGWILRSAETLEFDALGVMAEALVSGILGKGGPNAMGPVAGLLGPALRVVPGGGGLVVQFIVTLVARGQVNAAQQLVEVLRGLIQHARSNCIPSFTGLRELESNPSSGGNKDALLRQLEGASSLLVALIPTCSRVLEKGQSFPEGSTAVLSEALFSLASLHVVGATAAGQRLLHRALLAQERGREAFLNTLPRVALTLAQPKLVAPLWEAGLTPAHFQFGGRPFLERVALHTGRALVNPLLARGRKGDVATAKALLRSTIRNNAALFGLSPDGAYLAAEAIETQRAQPRLVPLKKTVYRLAKIRKKNALGQHPNSIEPFQDLINAIAAGGLPRPEPVAFTPTGRRLTLLEFQVDQSAQAKKKASVNLNQDQLEFPRR